jgi:hypothetical protein
VPDADPAALATLFPDPVVEHRGGHVIPSAPAAASAVGAFLGAMAARKVGAP